jgi:hypothetical protein
VTANGRIITIVMTVFVSLGCLIGALAVHGKVTRLATETPVMATVAEAWSERKPKGGGPGPNYAHLIFDRKQNDGDIVHCDVPRVGLGQQSTTAGATIKVAPRATTCWEPDVICETCAAPSDYLASGLLVAAAVFGLICSFLISSTLRKYSAA